MTDLEIAHATKLAHIDDVAAHMGIVPDELEHYGKHIAKLPLNLMGAPKGKLILVTAITATKAGIGKTTVSIGLALGLNRIGKKAVVALREPSLGPCFGMKGHKRTYAASWLRHHASLRAHGHLVSGHQ